MLFTTDILFVALVHQTFPRLLAGWSWTLMVSLRSKGHQQGACHALLHGPFSLEYLRAEHNVSGHQRNHLLLETLNPQKHVPIFP